MLHSLRHLLGRHSLLAQQQGAVLPLLAVVIVVLITVVSISVDVARIYTAQNRFQHASDAALLGGVATYNTNICLSDPSKLSTTVKQRLDCEVERLFLANTDVSMALNYMQARINNFNITEITNADGNKRMQLTFNVEIPLKLFGQYHQALTQRFSILSQTNLGFGTRPGKKLELTLVLDTTESMKDCPAGPKNSPCAAGRQKIDGLKTAANNLLDLLFTTVGSSVSNVFVSIVPYNQTVNLQNYGKKEWLQQIDLNAYDNGVFMDYKKPNPDHGKKCDDVFGLNTPMKRHFFFQNREHPPGVQDNPLGLAYNDVSDDPPNPSRPESLFHLPRDYYAATSPHKYLACRYKLYDVSPIIARSQSAADLRATIDGLVTNFATRINVGLLWGLATLSPNWVGIWPNGNPGAYNDNNVMKVLILMTDGKNEKPKDFTDSYHYDVARDNDSMLRLCNAARQRGIYLYVISFGSEASGSDEQRLMRQCAGSTGKFLYASDNHDLKEKFKSVIDDINSGFLLLTQ